MNNMLPDDTHFISLDTAVLMTARLRSQPNNPLPLSETFDRAAFDHILAQRGCTGLRLYYGMDETRQVHAIIVGINEKNEDMLPTPQNPDNAIVEQGKICPPYCSISSLLNV